MKSLLVISLIWCSLIARSQHVALTSQYQWNPVLMNPSFAGSAEGSEFTLSYRNQWLKLNGAPTTQYFSWNTLLKDNKLAVGAQIYRDVIGVTRNNGIYGLIGYNLKINKDLKLSYGLAGGVDFVRNYWSEVSTVDEDDPRFSVNSPLMLAPNFSAGIRLSHKKYFVSFSVPNMLTHTQIGDKLKVSNRFSEYNYLLGGAYHFNINREWTLRSGIIMSYLPRSPLQANFSATGVYNNFLEVGLAYRTQDAIITLIRFSPQKQLSIGYAFDLTLSDLASYTSGSHEISLSYRLNYTGNLVSPRFF